MDAPYTALEVASFFIKKGVSPLKLQKLLYFSQSWYYAKTGRTLFPEMIQAWIYGPVVYSVWDNFRFMKRSSVIPAFRAVDKDISLVEGHLAEVWEAYGHLTGSELVDLTHQEPAWLESRKGLLNDQPSGNEVIINNETTKHYQFLDNKIPKATSSALNKGFYSND